MSEHPVTIGAMVTNGAAKGRVVAIDLGEAWVRMLNGTYAGHHRTFSLDVLLVCEPAKAEPRS